MKLLDQEFLTIDVAVAKTHKYASRESGDTVELVERPGGGVSMVMIDGQGSGKAAKTLSLMLSARAVGMIKDGVRDGAVARATHDFLFAFRHGQVSATLDIVSVDLQTKEVVITRNADSPMLLRKDGEISVVPMASGPIGRTKFTKPAIQSFPAEDGVVLALFTDGVTHSGLRQQLDPINYLSLADEVLSNGYSAQEIADKVLAHARERDNNRPGDDTAVIVVAVNKVVQQMAIRRLQASFPVT